MKLKLSDRAKELAKLSAVENFIRRAAKKDGFEFDMLSWTETKNNLALGPDEKEKCQFTTTHYDFSYRNDREKYLQALDLPSVEIVDRDDIGVVYEIEEDNIHARVVFYLNHPEDFKQALRDCGSLKMVSGESFETISCEKPE